MKRAMVFLFFCAPLVSLAQMRIIPHLTRAGGDFTTQISLDNATLEEVTYSLTAYDDAGGMVAQVSGVVGGRTSLALDPFVIF